MLSKAVKARHNLNKFTNFKCLLEVEADPPSLVAGEVDTFILSNGTGSTSEEFIPTQPTRLTAATCIRISSPQSGTVIVVKVEGKMMFRDGT